MKTKRILSVYLVFAIIFCGTFFYDNWSNANVTSRALPVISQVTTGQYHFEHIDSTLHDKSIVEGKHYTDKAPLPTWLMIPIAFSLERMGWIEFSPEQFGRFYAISGFFIGTLPFLLILFLTWKRGISLARHPELLIIPFFGSFIFAYSASFYSHVFAGLLLILSLRSLELGRFWLAGFIMSAVFLSEYPLVLIGFIWGLQLLLRQRFKAAFQFGLGFLPGLGFLLFYNYSITGQPFQLLYKYVDPNYAFMHDAYGLGLPDLIVVFQLLFGLYKGLFLYCPVLILLVFWMLRRLWNLKITLSQVLIHPILVPFVAMLFLISSYEMWWGGWAFGPRHLLAPTILVLYYFLPKIAEVQLSKIVVTLVLFIGVVVSFLARFTYVYSIPSDVQNPLAYTFAEFLKPNSGNANNWMTSNFGCSPFAAALVFSAVFATLWLTLIRYQDRKGL